MTRTFWVVVAIAATVGCGKSKKKSAGGDPPAAGGGGSAPAGSSTEAKVMVERLYKGATAYFEENSAFYPTEGTMTPPTLACSGGKPAPHAPDPSWWGAPPWDALAFEMNDPHYYSYIYVPGPTSFSVIAVGDLDCDGTPGSFTLSAAAPAGEFVGTGMIQLNPNE